eukprot:2707102-Ditylum_brightwellii.AAC.1
MIHHPVGCCVSVGESIAVQQPSRFRQQTGQFLKADVLFFLVLEGVEVNQSTCASEGPQAFVKYCLKCRMYFQLLQLCTVTVA